MANIEASNKKKVEEKKNSLERYPSNSQSADGTTSDSTIFEDAPAATTAPVMVLNGGFAAWSAVAGGFLCQFASFGFLNV
jgi:MCP family monocarboxylic acid transporter-like MFS transporter 10